LLKNNLPLPASFSDISFDAAKGDVASKIASINLICLKKPFDNSSFRRIKEGYKLQDRLSKESDYVCKIYQIVYSSQYFYVWQEKGISLKEYLIKNPNDINNYLKKAQHIVNRLWDEHRIQYMDLTSDNFIIVNNRLKLIDFEEYDNKKLDYYVKHEYNNEIYTLKTSPPKTRTPKTRTLKTSTPKTRTLRTSTPKTRTLKTSPSKTSTPKTRRLKTSTPKTRTLRTSTPKN